MIKSLFFRVFAFSLFATGLVFVSAAPDTAPPPSEASLATVWVGFDELILDFYRLELTKDGKGYLTASFANDAPKLYSVKKWVLSGNSITFDLEPVDKGAEAIYMKGEAFISQMDLEIGGIGAQYWKRKIDFVEEQSLEEKMAKAKDRLEAFKKH